MELVSVSLHITPRGRLAAAAEADAPAIDAGLAERLLSASRRGTGHVLLLLGADEPGTPLPPVPAYWREFGSRFVAALCARPESEGQAPTDIAAPGPEELERLVFAAPPMIGVEYLSAALLEQFWAELGTAFAVEWADAGCSVADFLRRRNASWNLVGRVHFNLAENRKDPDAPFAFLATYTTRLSAQGKAQHLPLGQALREYAGAANRDRLLSLLVPVQRAAEACDWLKQLVDSGEIFHPLRWTAPEALHLLRDVPRLESAGVVVRMPAAWHGNRPSRPRVSAAVGSQAPSTLGRDALLDFHVEVTLEGETLTAEEIRQLLAGTEGLALVRGRWIEVDGAQLARMLDRFGAVERAARESGLAFGEAMRLLSGTGRTLGAESPDEAAAWSEVTAGPWLAEVLRGLRSPQGLAQIEPGAELRGELRAYQQVGVRWLYLLAKLGLGACLADDMGLGKTIQVLALLLVLKRERQGPARPSLLVAPASLLANWAAETERFAPSLKTLVAHPSAIPAAELATLALDRLRDVDLVITSYGSLLRLSWMAEVNWSLAVLDEAQAIKNPAARQSRAAKQLQARTRLVLTGTPVENRLGDLWSLFDFINPGLLGSARQFSALAKRLAAAEHVSYGPLRELVRPYILRRLKTDRSVIADLPEKTEIKAHCPLSRRQAALYQQAVKELKHQLGTAQGMARRGLVLAYLMRFKQICNHPSQWLGDNAWGEEESGKWARLREIAEVVAARQDKMLVFTQFREVIAPLAGFLASVFGRTGLVLHGDTAVKRRGELVERFQNDEDIPFFVLSLKAGGSGLNLTAASHVVHFDRWWNPAVENQATDRAFRIGQTRNVLVHKFICLGTVEEHVDQMIESKRGLSQELLEGGAELLLTEMKDDELLRLVSLDIHKALKET